jgi:hypothetical protein
MRRREFITLIGSLSVVWPCVARAQQAQKVPLVGVLMPFEKGDEEAEGRQSAFQNGLEQFGWRNGTFALNIVGPAAIQIAINHTLPSWWISPRA